MSGFITLPYVIEKIISRKLSEIHTCLPGQIVDYDYKTQKASVQPTIQKQYLDQTTETLPIITNVPVIWPRTKHCSLTFPILKDDYVLLLFTERAMELYLQNGGISLPGDSRQFHLTDCVCIPGLYPFSENSLSTNNTDILLIYNGNPSGETSIRIEGSDPENPNTHDGAIDIIGSDDLNITITNNQKTQIGGNSDTEITGTSNVTITGDSTCLMKGKSDITIEGISTVTMKAASILNIDGNQTESVTGTSTVTIGNNQTININGDWDVIAVGNINLTGEANLVANITGTATLTASSTTINGPVQINGSLDVSGNVTGAEVIASGIHLSSHVHTGVTTGPSKTGGPL